MEIANVQIEKTKNQFIVTSTETNFLFWPLAISAINFHLKVNDIDQINTIEKLETKLKYGVKDIDQIHILPIFEFTINIDDFYGSFLGSQSNTG